MITKYFSGICCKPSELPGFYVLQYSGETYYCCAYRDRNTGKTALSDFLNARGTFPKYDKAQFHFHHIVERMHLADISCSGDKVEASYSSMPAIMVYNREHYGHHSRISIKETRQLYMRTDDGFPAEVTDSEDAVRKMFISGDKAKAKNEIGERIAIMSELYRHAYARHSLIKLLAVNIFKDYANRLALM